MGWVLILYVVAIFGAFAGLVYWYSRNFTLRKTIVCPGSNEEVHVEFVCRGNYSMALPVRVKSCSAFENPRKIACERECMKHAISAVSPRRRGRRVRAGLRHHKTP